MPARANQSGIPPVSTAVRQRLQAVFEHAQRSAEKADYDYAHDLLTQCMIEDPANLIYLQHLLGNLANKYGTNKKGSRFAALRLKPHRMALTKAAGKGEWREAFTSACEALRINPWDLSTLLDVADAYEQLGCDECQLYTLRWALDVAPKDPTVNRRAALTLARLGQFDQAISCWRRVEQAKPGDEEAGKAISQLSVEKTIQQGGYSDEFLRGATDVGELEAAIRDPSRGAAPQSAAPSRSADEQREKELLAALESDPANTANYVELAEMFAAQDRYREATEMLGRALAASGGGDLAIRERLEDAHLRQAHHQVLIAQRRAEQQKTPDAEALARRMAAQANQAELEVYAARAARSPGNTLLQFELGLRMKKAGKFKEAIAAFQAARGDSRRKAVVHLNLGECFQHIRQFRLALSSYETAAESAGDTDSDTKKLALYRAGVLSADLQDFHRAEKHLTELAAIDFAYRDVADRLDKLAALRDSN